MSEQGFTISPWAFRDLTYMFNDPILVDQLLLTDEKQVAKYKKVNKDGSITLGKTSISWLNRLFGGEYVLNPETICLRLIKIITGMGSGRMMMHIKICVIVSQIIIKMEIIVWLYLQFLLHIVLY